MAVTKADIRSGVYYDSALLMQLQRSLAELPGVVDAGVIMGTEGNKEILAHIDLLSPEVSAAKPDDLVIVVRAQTESEASAAIAKVDGLLKQRKSAIEQEYRPQSLEMAVRMLPEASWVLISVAGRYAAGVARDALRLGKHVFLFSDNVSVEEEIDLKKMSAEKGLLVMGPDCGTAIIQGVGLGFANKVRVGDIGVVAAAGTGLQQVSSRIQQLGGGITFGMGTGGRDLSEKIGAVTFRQGLDCLSRDPDTKVIVLVSKPPAPKVADEVLNQAKSAGKPVVVNFIGLVPTTWQMDNLYFASSLDDASRLAVDLAAAVPPVEFKADVSKFSPTQQYLRGLFSGGTLAYEAQYILQSYLPKVYSNAPLNKENKLPNSLKSQEHTIIDLGEDEFTVGRLHPMMDNELRIRRMDEEARDPTVAVIMLDVVLGYGSHPDPVSELGPAMIRARQLAMNAGRYLEVVVVVTGTEQDPQVLSNQIAQLKEAGAWVETRNDVMVRYAGKLLQRIQARDRQNAPAFSGKPLDLAILKKPLQAINIGLESFAANLSAQEVPALHVDWRPPAGGNEKLMGILERMKKGK